MDDVLESMSDEGLAAELVGWAARDAAVRARFLAVLAVFVERRGWERDGCLSPVQWLSWQCGLGRVAASEHVRVAMALRELPTIRDGLSTGRLSWSKVREITRVATPDTDEDWAMLAAAGTAAHVERMVGAVRRITPEDAEAQYQRRGVWFRTDHDGAIVLTVRLPAIAGRAVIDSLQRATKPERGTPMAARQADRLVELVCGEADPVPAQVIIHIEASADGTCTVDGVAAIAVATAEQAACDTPVSVAVHHEDGSVTVSNRTRHPSPRVRRAILLRDRCCRFPGCHHDAVLQVHHLHHHFRGGSSKNALNLVALCPMHHRLIHHHDLRVEMDPDGTLRAYRDDGSQIREPIDIIYRCEPDPTDDPRAGWTGERLDLNHIIQSFDSRPVSTWKQAS